MEGASEGNGNGRPRAARVAVLTVFILNGLWRGNRLACTPAVHLNLELSDGLLGLALLGTAVGALLAMPTTGWLIARWGSRAVTTTAALALCLALPLPAFAPGLAWLIPALALLGAANGVLDVAMNAQAVAVERRYGRPIMTTFHGLWSLGGLIGAAVAGLVAGGGFGPRPHLLTVAAILLPVVALARRWLLPARVDAGSGEPAFARPSRALAGLGVVGFCALLGEGAIADWSAVYLRNDVGTGAGFAAAGYAAFSLAMAAGRFAGDALTARLGPVAIVRYGGLLVAVGLGAALAVGRPVATLVGFACVGAGLACVFPVILSAAGRQGTINPGAALAAVSTAGYAGFLAGPPLIGFVAELAGLRVGLAAVVLLAAAIVLLADAVGPARTADRGAGRGLPVPGRSD